MTGHAFTMMIAAVTLTAMDAAGQAAGSDDLVNDPVVAVPRSQAFYPRVLVPASADEPHIASGTGGGWHQVIFPVRKEAAADDAPDQRLQHAVAIDYTPATARIIATLEGRNGSISDPSGGWDPVWESPVVRGYGVNGRLYWCYSLALYWGYRYNDGTERRDWRVLFRSTTSTNNDAFSYRFSAEHTESVTCERDPENDGGLPGIGTGGDFGPFNIYVDGAQGQPAQIAIGIRDHSCEDGDLVSVFIGDGYGDRAIYTAAEIFNRWQERMVTVRAGYYYQIRAVAVNGTGGKGGGCDPPPGVNTGELRVRSYGANGSLYSSEINTWEAPGGEERAGIINVISR